MVKSTSCFSRRRRFNSYHLYDGSQPSITSVPGNLVLPWILWALPVHGAQTDMQANTNHTQLKINNTEKRIQALEACVLVVLVFYYIEETPSSRKLIK